MPRTSRCLADGSVYHVINRGNGKQRIFHKDQDFIVFIKLMKDAKERYPINILAYCLMPNHFHFVLIPLQSNLLSKWIHWLTTTHARRYHYYYKTSGHIWQGRFKSFIIQNNEHLITVLRYVEGNPVRAGLVSSAKDWLWSSHGEKIGLGLRKISDKAPIKLPQDWTKYVDESISSEELEKLHQSVNHQFPFGNNEWQREMGKRYGLKYNLRPRGRPKKLNK